MPERPLHHRGAVVDDRVLDACLELLAQRGYRFRVDEVAARADVHKTTIYRRFPTKALLVAAAMGRLAGREVPFARSEDPLADLADLLVAVSRALQSDAGRNGLQAAAAASAEDGDLLPVARDFLTHRYGLATSIIEDAMAAGAIRTDLDPTLVWESMVNPLHLRSILGIPFDDDTARGLLALVLEGCRDRHAVGSAVAPRTTPG